MNEILLLKGNPSKRRGKRRRSAAQRAATRRMLAANRGRFHSNPRKRRRKSSGKRRASASPVARRKTRRVHRVAGRGFSSGFVGLLKTGAIMGGGALVADVGMGLIGRFAPNMPAITSRVNADGSINYGYYAAKGLLIYGMAKYGTRITRHASTMATGALAVMGYELMRTFMPSDGTIPLGYFNPGRIVNGGNLGRIMSNPGARQNVGRIMSLPNNAGKGAVASATIRNLNTATARR